jgi:hypothetical protein
LEEKNEKEVSSFLKRVAKIAEKAAIPLSYIPGPATKFGQISMKKRQKSLFRSCNRMYSNRCGEGI